MQLCWTNEWTTFILACHSKSSQGFPSETKSLCLGNPFPMGKQPSSTSTLIIKTPWLLWIGGVSAFKAEAQPWSNPKLRAWEMTRSEILDESKWHIRYHIQLWACSQLRDIRWAEPPCQLIKDLFLGAFRCCVQSLESKQNFSQTLSLEERFTYCLYNLCCYFLIGFSVGRHKWRQTSSPYTPWDLILQNPKCATV